MSLSGTTYRGRFAPSPTGWLHLGSASTALCAWLAARRRGGRFLLRNEDIDGPRVVPGAMDAIMADLRWLGLDWDEGPDIGGPAAPYRQQDRTDLYRGALDLLRRRGLVYPCDCSRAEIARIASAPHAEDGAIIYPGTCRSKPHDRTFRKPPAWRLAVPTDPRLRVVEFDDACYGTVRSDVARDTGDFVLLRADGLFAYQLAVVVDDLTQGITEVVRGADLLSSTARQILLARLLGGRPPRYAHVPLVVDSSGKRLAKRDSAKALRQFRREGGDPRAVVAALARSLGLASQGEKLLEPRHLVDRFDWSRLPRRPVVVDVPW